MSKTYWEKLKDPRWQKLRLEAMQASNFNCESCGDSQSTLHVHHKEYFKGHEPWDYDVKQLSVLCDSCHESAHGVKDALKNVVSLLSHDEYQSVISLVSGFLSFSNDSALSDAVSQLQYQSYDSVALEAGVTAYMLSNCLNAEDIFLVGIVINSMESNERNSFIANFMEIKNGKS